MNIEYRLYIAAGLLVLPTLVVYPGQISSGLLSAFVFGTQIACVLCIAAGTLVWSKPIATRKIKAFEEEYSWGKALLWCIKWLLNSVIAIYVLGQALSFVANATGLPPTDFELTVAACAIVFFPFGWANFFSVAVIVIAFFAFFYAALRGIPPKFEMLSFVRLFGALVISAILLQSVTQFARWAHFLVKPVLWVAYYTEYHELSKYPKLKAGLRARVHENGVVSYAQIVDGEVQISIDTIQ